MYFCIISPRDSSNTIHAIYTIIHSQTTCFLLGICLLPYQMSDNNLTGRIPSGRQLDTLYHRRNWIKARCPKHKWTWFWANAILFWTRFGNYAGSLGCLLHPVVQKSMEGCLFLPHRQDIQSDVCADGCYMETLGKRGDCWWDMKNSKTNIVELLTLGSWRHETQQAYCSNSHCEFLLFYWS